jgi:hypothetical protein
MKTGDRVRVNGGQGFGDLGVHIAIPVMTAQQIAGADLAIENPFRAGLAFAVLEAKSGDTAAAARRLSSAPLCGRYEIGGVKVKKGFFLLTLLSFLSLTAPRARGQTPSPMSNAVWTRNGPYGGYVNGLAMAASNPDVVYAATSGGVYKSIDGAAHWTAVGLYGTGVLSIQVAPDDAGVVYVGTADGVYKSENGGGDWTKKGLDGLRVNTLAVDPTNTDMVYAGTGKPNYGNNGNEGVYKSENGGDNWTKKYSNYLQAVMSIVIDPENTSRLFVGVFTESSTQGFRRSPDGGDTWEGVQITVTGGDVSALAIAPTGTISTTLYLATSGGGIFKSINDGDSWSGKGASLGYALAVDPNAPDTVYAGKYVSLNGGDDWSDKSALLPPGDASGIVIDPRNSHVTMGLTEGAVCKSTDIGASWQFVMGDFYNANPTGLVTHPTDPDTAYATVSGNHWLARTTDGGASWTYLENATTDPDAVAVDPQNPNTLYVGGGGYDYWHAVYVHKSLNGGDSWSSTSLGWNSERAYLDVRDLWVHPNDSNIVLAAVSSSKTVGGGLFRSEDGGGDFDKVYSYWKVTTIAADPNAPDTVYMGTEQSGYVYRSPSAGSSGSWTRISPDGAWVDEVRDLDLDQDSKLYAATSGGLIRWDGVSWEQLTGLPSDDLTAVAVDHGVSPPTIYAGTAQDGVHLSTDGGNTWAAFNEGLTDQAIANLALSASSPTTLYAGVTYGGVWSRVIRAEMKVFLPLIVKQ